MVSIVVWRRRADVLWRLGPDRVLARRVGAEGVDLVGAAALVWVALDAPTDLAGLTAELDGLTDATLDVAGALAELESAGLIERT